LENFISAQSRSRRQEITVGITQQAALAIQNEKLHSEVVERERMERELQLAREIQQSFLPERLPIHNGWDLDVLWKPAREVGGDFYDVFDLPGNRLGLVIADVADKGMPAALFMTLVRTLIRATAREELSPSAVLEIVNDLLISDTKHGLFITVAYAIISLETGKIIFANAGHNLPLLIRQTRQLEILETTGMALGVLEGIHIADLKIELNQGDFLIFYTDGVTEAFSPDGEMFGEQRLREFILSNECNTAQQQLQAIDQAVQEFIGNFPYSDDITILTVRRFATEK
jgi:serine phosphatase RsbU (regulator of sigma subunit)